MNSNDEQSRRRFLTGSLAAAGAPFVWTSKAHGARRGPGPNDRINVGVIGVGNRSRLLIDQLPMEATIVALADCNFNRCKEFTAKKNGKWEIHADYRKLLEDKNIDGVIIGTHDHGRVLPSIAACQAEKDVYAEKPLTLYVAEGRTLVRAARKYKRVFQVGSQQRSMETNRIASEFVRNGGLGKIKMVKGAQYPGPKTDLPTDSEPIPEGLNWDMWLGQTPMRPYNKKVHSGWMGFQPFSGGEVTNWGAHGLDQIQAALGMSETGPIEFFPLEDGPPGSVGFRYANGVTVRLELPMSEVAAGGIFVGEKGTVQIVRNKFTTDPPGLITNIPRKEDIDKWRDEVSLWQAKYHLQDWLDCMRTRKKPRADVEIGHRSVSLCHLTNITMSLKRKLEWDPKKEAFKNDNEANALLTRKARAGYELPEHI
jgi:predicted dehydrogenase